MLAKFNGDFRSFYYGGHEFRHSLAEERLNLKHSNTYYRYPEEQIDLVGDQPKFFSPFFAARTVC